MGRYIRQEWSVGYGRGRCSCRLFHEYEVDGGHEADKRRDVVPVERLPLEKDVGDDGKHDQRHALLHHLELHERERPAVLHESDAVGRHLAAILKEGDAPREQDYANERPVAAHASLLELEVSVPSQSHENVAHQQEQHSVKSMHIYLYINVISRCVSIVFAVQNY